MGCQEQWEGEEVQENRDSEWAGHNSFELPPLISIENILLSIGSIQRAHTLEEQSEQRLEEWSQHQTPFLDNNGGRPSPNKQY